MMMVIEQKAEVSLEVESAKVENGRCLFGTPRRIIIPIM